MITIITDTQHIAKRYARIVGASDEDSRHYFGNNYAVTWIEGINLGFSPELRRADHEVHDIADGRYDRRIQKYQQGLSR